MQNIPTAYFSLEMSKGQIYRRLIRNIFNYKVNILPTPQCDLDEHLTLGYKVLKDTPLYIDDTFNLSLEELDKKIAELKAKGIRWL